MQIMVMNPAFPKDKAKAKAKALSAEQFVVVSRLHCAMHEQPKENQGKHDTSNAR